MKVYEVIFQDEYDNLYQLGFYRELDDAIPDLNGYLEYVPGFRLEKGDIREYPCTFGPAFDTFLWDLYEARMGKDPEDGLVDGMAVRGFVLDIDDDIAERLINV